jgi:hypothetical protein
MEHLDPATGEWLPDADKVRDVNEHIASILGMDYDGFVRSILLPQGHFQQFLAGKPEERRKVLDGLLRLDVYQLMQQRANEIATEHTGRADNLQQQLDTQFAAATPRPKATGAAGGLRSGSEALSSLRNSWLKRAENQTLSGAPPPAHAEAVSGLSRSASGPSGLGKPRRTRRIGLGAAKRAACITSILIRLQKALT